MSQFALPAVRKATPHDSAGILKCLHEAFEPYRGSYTPEAFADTVLTPETLQHRLASMCVVVAVSDSGEIVGTIGCLVVDPLGDPKKENSSEGHIRGMAVLPAWQGTGVAAWLLKTVESELRASGCSRISLDTTQPLQPAMRFYEKNGYHRSGRVTDFFGMPLFEYVKTLTPVKPA
ncbi:MAG: GNAT family N-acetyltransferase [Terriglobales bacterium]|jgi:GNAT superfamily N-acetyltransferase